MKHIVKMSLAVKVRNSILHETNITKFGATQQDLLLTGETLKASDLRYRS
jgi:hypothetical protein